MDISILRKAFEATKMTFAQAEEKVKAEASRAKINRFRINADGEYNIRICPLVPAVDADGNLQPMDRLGYEYPIHQLFLKIEIPSKKKGGKPTFITVPIIRTTDKGVDMSADLIDEYVKIAKEYGDEDVIKKVTSSSYEGGLRWSYQHAMYIINVEKRKDGIQLFQISHSQYNKLEAAKMAVWKDLREDDSDCSCPISDFERAYQVRFNRNTTNKKPDYDISVNTVKKASALSEDEMDALFSMDRIPDEIFRYTRYQFEATLEFLKQYDEKLQIDVCEQDDFKAIVEKIKGELSADDTSHFSMTGSKDDNGKKDDSSEVTLDSLWAEVDALADANLVQGSDEYAELREKIREFVTAHDIDIRLGHSKSNEEILEEIEEIMSAKPNTEKAPEPEKAEVQEDEPKDEPEEEQPARRRRAPRPEEDEEDQVETPAAPAVEEPAPAEPVEEVTRRRRRK